MVPRSRESRRPSRAPSSSSRTSDSRFAFHAGAGVDVRVSPRASVFLDARYVFLDLPDVTAAALGCRFATAYRAVTRIGGVLPGENVAVLGSTGMRFSLMMDRSSELAPSKIDYVDVGTSGGTFGSSFLAGGIFN